MTGQGTGERIIGSDAAVAVDRFAAGGALGYRAKSGGPVRETRAEAEADYHAFLDAPGRLSPLPTDTSKRIWTAPTNRAHLTEGRSRDDNP